MSEKYYTEAVVEALRHEMNRDENVVVMGLDVKPSIWGTTRGLYEEFGPKRIMGMPVCEGSFTMAGVGAAITGLRPIVELLFSEYAYLAMETIINVAGQWGYVSNNGFQVPLVVQTFSGPRGHGAYAHSQSTQASLLNSPGIKIIIPSTPADAKGLVTSAIRDNGPVLVFHDRQLLAMTAEVPEGEHVVPIGEAIVKRPGSDVTLVSFGAMLYRCIEAAGVLEKEGISTEVIDLRTVVPLDEKTIAESLQKTNRLVVVEDGRKRGGIGSEIAAVVAEKYMDFLDGPIMRVAALDTPVPFSAPLEKAHFPGVDSIVSAVQGTFG
ncbi:MAG: alpha-ketoacid dehydrogenase subunit beta [Deltaproteobacteria bacterium]|nr:MAG: alpha-ketoacid dehydrogenase subunit beta [Deltaproteobacteria bacterium]